MLQLGDSLEDNLSVIQEVLAGMPRESRRRAQKAAVAIENVITRLQKDHPNDAAIAAGVVLATHVIAQRLSQTQREARQSRSLIHLLS